MDEIMEEKVSKYDDLDKNFNPEEYETQLTESLDADITDFFLQNKIDKQKEEIKAKVAEKIKK